jgi:hypothetical protein
MIPDVVKNTKSGIKQVIARMEKSLKTLKKSTVEDDTFWEETLSLVDDSVQLRAEGAFLDGYARAERGGF